MEVVDFGRALEHHGVDPVVLKKPPDIVAVMLLHGPVEFIFEVKDRTHIGLSVDVTCNVLRSWFGDENAANVHFVVVAKHFEFEVSGPDKADIECATILNGRSMTLDAIALVVSNLVEIGVV